MRRIWVLLLAVVAYAMGAFGTMAYLGGNYSVTGMRIGCELLDRAEALGLLTKQQRANVVERVQKDIQRTSKTGDAETVSFIGKFKNGCPTSTGR